MANERNGGSVAGAAILGLLIGGAIGAALALLFAPSSGAATRRRIRETGNDLRDRTTELVEESSNRVREFAEDSRERINDLVEDVREEMNEAMTGLRGIIEEGKRAYRDRRRELAKAVEPETAAEEEIPQAAPTDEKATT